MLNVYFNQSIYKNVITLLKKIINMRNKKVREKESDV